MRVSKVVCVLVLVLSVAGFALAAEVMRNAKIVILEGQAEVKKPGEAKWVPARVGMILTKGDILRTKDDSWVFLNLNGNGQTAVVEVDANSRLTLSELVMDEEKGTQRTLLDLAMGEVLIKAKKLHAQESRFEVKTPTSVVGVRGTRFSVKVEAFEE